ncbi:hypothetical protein L1D09_21680 [Vibrio tubiashii]|uniref:hypothetical protein n=2 Tax=Vibrio tubiashii TaxID=29498 RepID=UPI001EFC3E57|nr:hypothetical protein [Vibrio tubiashii]MCG9584142.1 hypothetical protein [Vibrio tubiashii]MCG9617737.1 hypothetical protein [Vibrio tubiashii]
MYYDYLGKNKLNFILTLLESRKMAAFVFILAISSYMIPWLYGFYLGDSLYVNAWDEETYLSITTAKDTTFTLGYFFSSIITIIFQSFNVSGIKQNFIFDSLLTSVTLFLIYKLCRILGDFDRTTAVLSAIILLFSSVLTNYANPLVYFFQPFFESVSIPLVMPGLESYISALRSPEPQLSYFLIALFGYLRVRYKKDWLLFVPIPFLYHFVALGYFSFLTFYLFHSKLRNKYMILSSSIIVPLLFSICLLFFRAIAVEYGFSDVDSIFPNGSIDFNHDLNLPLELILMIALFITRHILSIKASRRTQKLLLGLIFQVFALANMQLISGFTISFKNFHDYVFPVYFGGFMVIFFNEINNEMLKRIGVVCVGLWIVAISYLVYVPSVTSPVKSIWFGRTLSESDMNKLKEKTECVVVLDQDYAAKVSYINAYHDNALFSYQNRFVSHNIKNHGSALLSSKMELNEAEKSYLDSMYTRIKDNINKRNTNYGPVCDGQYIYMRTQGR